MMVIDAPLPPSRAGSISLIAGDLALDFANSESGRGHSSRQDHLQAPLDVADWLGHSGVLDQREAANLRAHVEGGGSFAATLLAQARGLREDIHAIGAATAHRTPPPAGALANLVATHARCIACAALAPREARRQWRWSVGETPLEGALGPVALAAVTLLTDRDPDRIKECGGVGCGWLFYDASKSGRRRWCEMEVCGNRAKQRRRAARSRGA